MIIQILNKRLFMKNLLYFSFTHIHILFHYGLSQDIEYSSLWYTIGSCCLSILNVVVCIYQPQNPSPFLSLPTLPYQSQICSLCLWICFYLFSSVQFSHSLISNSLGLHELQHITPPCPSPSARVYPNPCPLSRWCHPTISSSVVPFSSCSQYFPASGSFQMNQFFASDGQSIAVGVPNLKSGLTVPLR